MFAIFNKRSFGTAQQKRVSITLDRHSGNPSSRNPQGLPGYRLKLVPAGFKRGARRYGEGKSGHSFLQRCTQIALKQLSFHFAIKLKCKDFQAGNGGGESF